MKRYLCFVTVAVVAGFTAAASAHDSSASRRVGPETSGARPVFTGGGLAGPTYVEPGSEVVYSYQVVGKRVRVLRLTLVIPRQMRVLRKGSTPWTMVKGKPTWVMRNINNLNSNRVREFTFKVKVSQSAKPGSKYIVRLLERAQSGEWRLATDTQVLARVTAGR